MRFQRIVTMIVVRRCWNGGASVAELAEKAKVSKSTIRRWLKTTGANL